MQERAAQGILDRVNDDEGFRNRFEHDIPGVLAEFDLSHTEQMALASTDEDALRRLAGANVDMEATAFWKWLSRLLCTRWFCGPGGTRDWQCKKQP